MSYGLVVSVFIDCRRERTTEKQLYIIFLLFSKSVKSSSPIRLFCIEKWDRSLETFVKLWVKWEETVCGALKMSLLRIRRENDAGLSPPGGSVKRTLFSHEHSKGITKEYKRDFAEVRGKIHSDSESLLFFFIFFFGFAHP